MATTAFHPGGYPGRPYGSFAGKAVDTYPDPADVLVGVQYGPTGSDYTGTLSVILDLETGRIVKLLGRKVGLSL